MGLLFLERGGHVLNVMTNQKKFGEEKRVFQNLLTYFSFFADIYRSNSYMLMIIIYEEDS